MLLLHAHTGFDMGAHAIHYGVVALGVLGLVAILSPQFLATPPGQQDEHEARVLALRAALDPQPDRARRRTRLPVLTKADRALLPLAVVSSTAAAGVHAAVAPEHARESLLFGLFFWGSALLQLLWAGAVSVNGSRRLLVLGAVGNLAVVALWVVTRTLGLPFGLLPEPEAVGPWDVACAGWELVVVWSCLAILRSHHPAPPRLVDWRHWHPALPTYVAGSVLLLVALSLSGAGA
jgi:hypothetical protein